MAFRSSSSAQYLGMGVESIILPKEVLCQIFQRLGLQDLLICRCVNREWSIASTMTLTLAHPPINFQQRKDIGIFNLVMASSTLLPYSKFIFDPQTMHWRKRAVNDFLSFAQFTTKYIFFGPREYANSGSDAYFESPPYLYDTKEFGETLFRIITEFTNLVTYKMDCKNRFKFPQDELGKQNPLKCLQHLDFTFPYTFINNEPMLLAALLDLTPNLRRLEVSFVLTGTYEKPNSFFMVMDILENLRKSVPFVLRMELRPQCQRHFESTLPFTKLISLGLSLVSIDLKGGFCFSQWEENLWALIGKNYANLKSLSLQNFRTDLCLCRFNALEVLIIRRKLDSRLNFNLSSVFENVRIFYAGDIHSAIFIDFMRNFKNLEEFRMGCIAPNAWHGITGEHIKKSLEHVLESGFENTGKSSSPFLVLKKLKLLHLGIIFTEFYENTKMTMECVLALLYVSKNGSLRRLDHLILSKVDNPSMIHPACSQLRTYHKYISINYWSGRH